jgi:serine/threonine protein kinase
MINNTYRITDILLGKGAFSKVYMGNNILTGENVAIKVLDLGSETLKSNNIIDKINFEIFLMKNLKHPNIVSYFDVVKKERYWYIIMEYCNIGTFDNIIKYNEKNKANDNVDREKNSRYYLSQLKDALSYLKDSGYYHRDIKPENILLTDRKNVVYDNFESIDCYYTRNHIIVKLSDFGLSKKKNELTKTFCGSPLYMAPEILLHYNYNSKVDLWSYGVVMYRLLFGTYPNYAKSVANLTEIIRVNEINIGQNNYSENCIDLLKKLLKKNNKERINWNNFFDHAWFLSHSHHDDLEPIDFESSQGIPIKNSALIKNKYDSDNNLLINYVLAHPVGKNNISTIRRIDQYVYSSTYPPNKNTTENESDNEYIYDSDLDDFISILNI